MSELVRGLGEGAKSTSLLPQEGAKPTLIQSQAGSPLHNFQNQKLCSISPVLENSKNGNTTQFPELSTLEDIEDPYWYDIHDQEDVEDKNTLETLPYDVPYLRLSIRNLRYHQPIDAKVLKATSGISVKQALQINE
jgi:hypothetical protein